MFIPFSTSFSFSSIYRWNDRESPYHFQKSQGSAKDKNILCSQGKRSTSDHHQHSIIQRIFWFTLYFGLCKSDKPLFSSPFDLSTVGIGSGFKILGETGGDRLGAAASLKGDFNGDGFADIVLGAYGAEVSKGRTYLIYGRNDFPVDLIKPTLPIENLGCIFVGQRQHDQSGWSLSFGHDVNGDGLDDLLIGAPNALHSDNKRKGKAYLIYGTAEKFPSPFPLASLNGTYGMIFDGEQAGDRFGISVSLVEPPLPKRRGFLLHRS